MKSRLPHSDRIDAGQASRASGSGRARTLLLALLFCVPAAFAQTTVIEGGNLQKRANGVLALMGYMLTPDVTTGSLAITDGTTDNPGLSMTSLGGGFTISRDLPLYLEGTAAYARYDPTFVASNGADERAFPAKWNSVSGTAGIGWDFRIAGEWVLRPMFNFSLGHVESDLSIATDVVERRTNRDIDFLDNGQLDAVGVGGSLMLDYEHYRPEGEIDLELRYTDISLHSFGDTSDAVSGQADARSAAAWARWRAPTGIDLLERPLRYVLEFAHTQFFGDLRGALGFDWLTSVGAGLELDSGKYDMIVTRTRLLVRYKFGDNVEGWSVGLAVSF
ncbi:MAG TPA: hypothetical protein VFV71_08435 [Burkholderiales bacterium]|nr:hypothetical protein [Burkholderiales bacterium]